MKKLILFLFLLSSFAAAQNTQTGNITTAGSDCSVATNCVSMVLASRSGAVAISLSGTFSATAQFEVSADNGTTWQSAQGTTPASGTATSATAAGIWRFAVSGLTNIRVRASVYSSGTVIVTIQSSVTAASLSSGSGLPAGCATTAAPGAATLSAAISSVTTGGAVCAKPGTYTESALYTWSDTNSNVTVLCLGACTWKQTTAATKLLSVTGTGQKYLLGNWTLDGNSNNAALWSCDSCSNFTMDGLVPQGMTFQNAGTNAGNGVFQISAIAANVSHVHVQNFRALNILDHGLLETSSNFTLTDVRIQHAYLQENSTTVTHAAIFINPDHPYDWGTNVINDIVVDSAARCFYVGNPAFKLHVNDFHCKQVGGSGGAATIADFGCQQCEFTNIFTDDGGVSRPNEMIGCHDEIGTIWRGLIMKFSATSSSEQPINCLDTWGSIIEDAWIGSDIGTTDLNSNPNAGFQQSGAAINISNANNSNSEAHNQIKNVTIYTPTSYTGTLITLNSSGTSASSANGTEVSGVHGVSTGGSFLNVTTANAGTATDIQVHDNEIRGFTNGITTTGNGITIFAHDNIYPSTTNPWVMSGTSKIQLKEGYGFAFAKVPAPGNLINGSLFYVTDANSTCAAGASTGKNCGVTNGGLVGAF